MITITEKNNNGKIIVTPRTQIRVKLHGIPSSGFRWELESQSAGLDSSTYEIPASFHLYEVGSYQVFEFKSSYNFNIFRSIEKIQISYKRRWVPFTLKTFYFTIEYRNYLPLNLKKHKPAWYSIPLKCGPNRCYCFDDFKPHKSYNKFFEESYQPSYKFKWKE